MSASTPPWIASVTQEGTKSPWTATVPAIYMPWGKHKGKPLADVPSDYLKWALANATLVTPELRADIERVLNIQPATLPLEPDLTAWGEPTPAEDGDPAALNEQLRALRKEDAKLLKDAHAEIKKLRKSWDDANTKLKNATLEVARLKAAVTEAGRGRAGDPSAFRRLVKQWYGAISRKYHPDMGGTAANQTVVNVCYRELIERLDQLENQK